jgi:hypothetical protein
LLAGAAALIALAMATPAQAVVSPGGWYGYAVTGSTYHAVTGSWHVPILSCTSTASFSSIWIGLDGYTSQTVEQVGTGMDCSGGKVHYYGWYEMYPAAPVQFANPVSPGDAMSASVTFTAPSSYTLTLTDATQGWNQVAHASLSGAARSSAEALVEDPDDAVFTPINFTGVTVDGSQLGSLNPTKITGADSRIVVSPVNGGSFSVSWQSITSEFRAPPPS